VGKRYKAQMVVNLVRREWKVIKREAKKHRVLGRKRS
jgi:hypothetical protein